jgi:GT2 family glycosyltransferase
VSAEPVADAPRSGSRSSTADALVIAVVLNLNEWRDTVECVESLANAGHERLEAIVVDNGSTDDSVSELRSRFPGVELIEAGRNAGFASGNNLGIRRALERGADFVWLLNDDTVVEPGALEAMLDVTDREPRAGVIGCVLLEYHVHAVQAWGGGTMNPAFGLATVLTAPADDLAYISGACMLLPRDVLASVGLLDESFFLFMEDVDLCYRVSEAGWSIAIAPDGFVRHKGNATVGRSASARELSVDRVYAESCGIFMGKHSGLGLVPCATARALTLALRRVPRGETRRIPALVAAFGRGVRTGYRSRRA